MLINHKIALLTSKVLQTLLLSSALIGFTANNVIAKNSDIPVRFAKGQITSTITGKLKPNEDERWYRLNATSGQYAVINISPLLGTAETANVGVLHMPSGKQDGTKGGIVYQGCLQEIGEYRLRVARNLMATHGKTAGYTVEVIILPEYASKALCENK